MKSISTDGMKDVSVIIPFCNENPLIRTTIQSIYNELHDYCSFDIVAINNFTPEVEEQGFPQDTGYSDLSSLIEDGRAGYLKLLWYKDKLSHWNAKNAGLEVAEGKVIFFCDAHILVHPGSLRLALDVYRQNQIHGSLHLPISYMNERRGRELIYLCVYNEDLGLLHYRFTHYTNVPEENIKERIPFRVPCMSTCGMLIDRNTIINTLDGWPTMMGIYGGGENYLNYVQAVLGLNVYIMPGNPIYHYAAPRGYRWNHYDWMRNRFLAIYLAGGSSWLVDCCEAAAKTKQRGSFRQLYSLVDQILADDENVARRKKIEDNMKITPEEWIAKQIEERPKLMYKGEGWK